MITPETTPPESQRPTAQLRGFAKALLMVAASTLLGLLVAPRWGNSAVDLLYLPAVLGAAVLAGRWPALLAALASTLAYNFFFTAPHFTFRIDNPADIVTVVILFIVALVASQLAASIRTQARLAAAHAARNATIAGLARRLLSCSTEAEIAEVAAAQLAELFDCNAVIVAGAPVPTIIASAPDRAALTPSDLAVAALVIDRGESAGRGLGRVDPAEWQFHAIRSGIAILAAVGLARDDGTPPLAAYQRPLLDNLLDQVALALERARLESEMREVDGLRERDRLRAALLSSVGHDLRTPLTAIIAAAAELRRADADDTTLVATIATEAAKLERYISNLLDMARIEAGAVKLKLEPVDLVDAVSAALRDVRPSLDGRDIAIDLPADLPLVRADAQLLHHCLINLLDNAGRHSPPNAPIAVRGAGDGGDVLLSIADHGPGLHKKGEPALETFVSIAGSDRTGGTGLGLAIVKGFAEAMGVAVSADDRPGGPGALLTLRFPAALVVATTDSAIAG